MINALIFDVEHDRFADVLRHAELLDELASVTGDQELVLIVSLFKNYVPAVEIGEDPAAKDEITALINSAEQNSYHRAEIIGRVLFANIQASEGSFFLALTGLNRALQQ